MSLYYLYTINYFIWVSIDTFAFCFLLFEKQLGKYPKKQLICFSGISYETFKIQLTYPNMYIQLFINFSKYKALIISVHIFLSVLI